MDYPYLCHDAPLPPDLSMSQVPFYTVPDLVKHGKKVSLHDFGTKVHPFLPELYTSVFFSTKDAIDSHYDGLSSNHLEALSDLKDLRNLLEPISDLTRLVKSLRERNLGKAARSLLDLLADVKLLIEFGVKPTIADIEEISAKASMLVDKYRSSSLFDTVTVHGSFVYDIPDDLFPFSGCKLISRSKVRVGFSEDSLLTLLLPIKAAGFLPTLGTIWDLIPFSFVVDWAANIGARFDAIDSSAMLTAFTIPFSVHSIKVVYGFEDEWFNLFKVAPILGEDDRPGYTAYLRSIMYGCPHYLPSRFDFTPPTGPSDWGTAGSLVYKVMS
jgi:hypothetical protein